MVKALLLHVGVDQSENNAMTLGINGPIFDDGTFEFNPNSGTVGVALE